MFGKRIKTAIAGAALCGLAAPVMAGSTTQDLQQQIATLKKQVAQLQQNQDQNQSWLDQRKKAEVKNLVQDVMNDASTRSSMLQSGDLAGISEDGKIYLRSADGSFSFNPYGLFQFQYIYNNLPNGAAVTGDENVGGFQTGILRFGANGTIGSPNIGYHFELTATPDSLFTSSSNDITFDEYYIYYKFDNGLKLTAGRFKQPFSRAFLINDGYQMTVERSLVDYYFGVGRSQGAMLSYRTDKWQFGVAVNNGSRNLYSNYYDTSADFAITARADYKVTGDWAQLADSFNSWSGTDQAIFVGAAVDYENGHSGGIYSSLAPEQRIKYTADASLQNKGLSLYLAGFGNHVNDVSGDSHDDFGVVAQAAYFVVPDKVQPFIRYSGLYLDNSYWSSTLSDTAINTLSAGLNWYQHRNNAKFTLDGVYVFNAMPGYTRTLSPSTEGGEIAIRAQYQLMF